MRLIGNRTYNGFRLADIVEDHGTNRLGIDTLAQAVTRGLLLDVAAVRATERLLPGEVITVADAETALAAGESGPGLALAGWLADRRVELTGCDTTAHVRAADHPRTARPTAR